ncbi:MAG: VWA domain-containing protein [Oligoflexia bacterium]|nr:VWA domain-containing protein [Oligoflexia bacterium]
MILRSRLLMTILIIAIVPALSSLYVNCGDPRVRKNQSGPSEQVPIINERAQLRFCNSSASQIKSQLKFIFVIDESASNIAFHTEVNPQGQPVSVLPTDPSGARRYDSLITFVNDEQNLQSEDVLYSIMTFNEAARLQKFSNQKPFSFSKEEVIDRLQNLKNSIHDTNRGGSSFKNTISEIRKFVEEDLEEVVEQNTDTQIVSVNYIIFFMSDGRPSDQSSIDGSDILAKLQELVNVKDANSRFVDKLTFNTAYYYEFYDDRAHQLMETMSSRSGGKYLESGSRQNIDFSQFAPPTRDAATQFVDFWLMNKNTVWINGILKADSDGDLLADELESSSGSNPRLADSDGDGVADGVQYIISGFPCQSGTCPPQLPSSAPVPNIRCANIEKTLSVPIQFTDRDGDGLNQCEEILLRSEPDMFDTNEDGIPDRLALVQGLPIGGPPSVAFEDPDIDGVSSYYELKFNSPAMGPNGMLHQSFKQMDTQLVRISPENDTQTCLQADIFNVATLPLLDQRPNEVQIFLIENASVSGSRSVLRTTTKPYSGGGVKFEPADFLRIYSN